MIAPDETIMTAYCEYCSGPGWVNPLCTVVVRRPDNSLRLEYLQPDEQPAAVRVMFAVSASMQIAMVRAIALDPPHVVDTGA